MRIGLDARLLPYQQKEGMATYASHLIRGLLKQSPADEFIFFYNFFRRGRKKFILDLKEFKNGHNRVFRIPGSVLDWFWMKAYFPPIELFLGKLDIFHTLGIATSEPHVYITPQLYGKRVVTLHDTIPLKFPQEFRAVLDLKKFREALIYVISKADAVVCNSECTRKDIIELCAAAQKKVCVVYHGVGEDFYRVTDERKISEVLARYRIKRNYIINVSRLDYNKNTTTLIRAFGLFKKNHDLKLVIVGKSGDKQEEVFSTIDKLELTDSVIYTGYIPHEDLVVLLSAAKIFVFPTLYEGFGLPNLEAMKCGVPVVSSDIAAVKEIAADAALLVDPCDPQELSGAMCKVISDRSLRDSLIAKGRERVKLFTWEKTAEKTLEVYRTIAGAS